jgi:hypothetical protein
MFGDCFEPDPGRQSVKVDLSAMQVAGGQEFPSDRSREDTEIVNNFRLSA